MWGRAKKQSISTERTKFDRLSEQALIDCLEAEMCRTGELFRGFNHSELDQGWVVAEMLTHLETAKLATEALQRRVAEVQSIR